MVNVSHCKLSKCWAFLHEIAILLSMTWLVRQCGTSASVRMEETEVMAVNVEMNVWFLRFENTEPVPVWLSASSDLHTTLPHSSSFLFIWFLFSFVYRSVATVHVCAILFFMHLLILVLCSLVLLEIQTDEWRFYHLFRFSSVCIGANYYWFMWFYYYNLVLRQNSL